jgi:glycosyltransferase involved in cell wall biosynthesis
MRILEVCSGTAVNGAVLHCRLLTEELARRGHSVALLCRPGVWIGEQMRGSPVEVIPSDLHRFPTDELRRVAELVRRRRIDVIHTHMSRASFFGVLLHWITGVPVAATAHNRYFQLHWRFNNLVIAVSEATRKFHRRWNLVPDRRIETIHNFVTPSALAPVPDSLRDEVRAELGIDTACPLLGVVGTVIPRKGLLHLLRALPQVLSAAPEARLAIVGKEEAAPHAAFLKQTAQDLGVAHRILWLGHRADVRRILAALDLCVLASIEESFPLTILEAMAARLPVVATAVGGVPECVHDGETGLLVPPADHRTLAKAIISLLAAPRRRRDFGEAGRRRVCEAFSPESQIARIEAALARLALGDATTRAA